MVIDCEKKLNEKQAKELKSSLNYMIDNLLQQKGERFSFSIQFDNGSVFAVGRLNKKNYIVLQDVYGDIQHKISLQEALNINKYALDIQNKLAEITINPEYEFKGFITEQYVDKLLPIFAEKEIKLRAKNIPVYVNIENVLKEKIIEDEFER